MKLIASCFALTLSASTFAISGGGGGGSTNPSTGDIDPYPSTGNTYHWPLTGNLGSHDPTLIKEGDTWWQFQTGSGIYGKVSYDGGTYWEPLPSVLPNGL